MEKIILVSMWLLGFVGFLLFVPRKDWRKGMVAVLVFKAIVWLCDMPAFQFDLLSAPVRLLPKASDLALTIEYIFYPVLYAIYFVHKKSIINFLVWVSAITIFDIALERYTNLLEYEKLKWYGMYIYIIFLFFVSDLCCNWFLKDKGLSQLAHGGQYEN